MDIQKNFANEETKADDKLENLICSKDHKRDEVEMLIPIRLNLTDERHTLHEYFLWNVNEKHVEPQDFAIQMSQELDLPKSFEEAIVKEIERQLSNVNMPNEGDPERMESIRLDINVNGIVLRDMFEWDVNASLDNNPEVFAQTLAADLGLSGEFAQAIAFSIREQVHTHLSNPDLRTDYERNAQHSGIFHESSSIDQWTPAVYSADQVKPRFLTSRKSFG